jgi:hypothetical protein
MISYFVYILLDHDDFERTAAWKLLLPVVPLIFQICCPTLAGWIIVLVPVTCYVIFLSYAFCYGLVTRDFEISGIFAGGLVMAGLAFLCYLLIRLPTKKDIVNESQRGE